MKSAKVGIFVPDSAGHHPSYIRMLVREMHERNRLRDFKFFVSRELLDNLDAVDKDSVVTVSQCEMHIFTAHEMRGVSSGSAMRRSYYRWRLLCEIVRKDRNIKHVFIAYLDSIQMQLAIGLKVPNGVKLSGIFFRPRTELLQERLTANGSATQASRRIRKFIYRRMLTNPCISTIFCLDERFAQENERWTRTNAIRFVPDPIPITQDKATKLHAVSRAIDSKQVFRMLFFGAISERKGIFPFLDALQHLNPPKGVRFEINIAGTIDGNIRMSVINTVSRISIRNLAVNLDERFLSDDELAELIASSSCIIAPYQQFIGSSGVVLWAAALNKPIITQHCGWIGNTVKEYKLGIVTDTTKPIRICKAIEDLYRRYDQIIQEVRKNSKRLVLKHDSRRFSKTILDFLVS